MFVCCCNRGLNDEQFGDSCWFVQAENKNQKLYSLTNINNFDKNVNFLEFHYWTGVVGSIGLSVICFNLLFRLVYPDLWSQKWHKYIKPLNTRIIEYITLSTLAPVMKLVPIFRFDLYALQAQAQSQLVPLFLSVSTTARHAGLRVSPAHSIVWVINVSSRKVYLEISLFIATD